MSSFFHDDEDSDAERAEKQNSILNSIRAERLSTAENLEKAIASEREASDDGETLELGSEEAELRRLRENAKYQQYATSRKRHRSTSPDGEKSRRTKTTDCGEEACSLGSSAHESEGSREGSNVGSDGEAAAFEMSPARIMSDEWQRTEKDIQAAVPSRPSNLRVRDSRVDPKVIDDSSSDGSSSDDSLGPTPIGPALPAEHIVPEAGRVAVGQLPIANEAVLGANHGSYVSSITIDRAGNRLVTGSIDSTIRLWDFNSMDRSLRSFRIESPLGEAPIRNLQYAPSGGLLLCSGGTNSASILHRDGYVLSQTMKGDMYIVDMARTKGHTGAILSGRWRPTTSSSARIFATSSADSTIRLWDASQTKKLPMVDNLLVEQLSVIKLRNSKGSKVVASALEWTSDGKTCVIACNDGKIKVLDPESYSTRPVDESRTFLLPGCESTAVTIAPNSSPGRLILVRSTDDCLRVFDQRNLTTPVKEFRDLPNAVTETNACFIGETGDYFMTGTSANRKSGAVGGSLRLFATGNLEEIWKSETEETAGSVVHTVWHQSINQVLYGTADGKVRVLYHPTESRKGILSCLSKSDYRKKHGIASVGVADILSPSVLHNREARSMKRGPGCEDLSVSHRQKRAASESLKPKTFPTAGVPQNASSQTFAKHMASKHIAKEWTGDPREAILKYAEIAKADPKFTTAYRATQPETILAEKTAEQEEEESRRALYEKDRIRKLQSTADEKRSKL